MGTLADLAESGDADALSAAIADGAHLDEADDEGNTATHKAAQGEPECLRLLLSHGATVDSANAEGSTPLIEAVKYGDRECVAIILEAGAAMAHLDATGRSALGYAEDEVADAEIISMLGGTARAEPVEERKPANTGRRCSVSSESVDPSQKVDLSQIPRQEKDEATATRISAILGKSILFKALDANTLKVVIDSMTERRVATGEPAITQGEDGDYYYIVESGALSVHVQRDKSLWGKELGRRVLEYEPGQSFGELALMYNTPRAASVVAESDCVLWAMERVAFRSIVMQRIVQTRKLSEELLAQVPLFQDMDSNERANIADAVERITFRAGERIIQQGLEDDWFYVLASGEAEASCITSSGELKPNLRRYSSGACFGELALLRRTERTASVTAVTNCELFRLDRGAFKRLLGGATSNLERLAGQCGATIQQHALPRLVALRPEPPPPRARNHLQVHLSDLPQTLPGHGESSGAHPRDGGRGPGSHRWRSRFRAGAARVGSGRGGDAADAAACAAAFEGWRADGALSPADGDDALPPRVRAGKDERRGQLAVRRYPFTRPKIRAVREDFGTAPEDSGTLCCIIKFRTTWRRVSLFFLSLFV